MTTENTSYATFNAAHFPRDVLNSLQPVWSISGRHGAVRAAC
jgi:hypothetical protein